MYDIFRLLLIVSLSFLFIDIAEFLRIKTISVISHSLHDNISAGSFGALGDDIHDDTAALLEWVSALSSKHMQGNLPCGSFAYKRTLVFGSDVGISGAGPCTVLHYQGEGDAMLVTAVSGSDPAGGAGNNRFENFQLVNVSATFAGAGLHMRNASDFVLANLRIHNFYRGILVEGGNAGSIFNPEIRSGILYKTFVPGSASIAVEPFEYVEDSAFKFACANSLSITSPDIGGNDSNYSVEAGLKVTCVDGLYLGSGHIGAVQNDVEITRIAGKHMNALSMEINGYLDGARRAVYVAPPFGKTQADGGDSSGGMTAHLRLKPFQVANQFGNAIEIDDPTADVGISDVDFAHVEGWGVYAPHVGKLSILGNKFETVGHVDQGTGGIAVGLFPKMAASAGAAGSATAVMIQGNQFYGVTACIFVANVGESLVQGNLTHDCRSGHDPLLSRP